MTITIATWNVNSIKTRLHQLLPWLENHKPDIVLLQETKCLDEAFPRLEIESLGYNLALHGQKTYNGVAILSKFPLEDVVKNIPTTHPTPPVGGINDHIARSGDRTSHELASCARQESGAEAIQIVQSRYIEAVISTPIGMIRVASIYVPNGQDEGSEKFQYKLNFLEQLETHIEKLKAYEEMLVLGGDYNVAPYDADVYNPQSLYGTVCFHPEEHKRFRRILHEGMLDAFRLANPENNGICPYTWWDYRSSGFDYNKGMRIDHLLLSPQAADHLKACVIERDLRGQERPSDHVPVVGTFM